MIRYIALITALLLPCSAWALGTTPVASKKMHFKRGKVTLEIRSRGKKPEQATFHSPDLHLQVTFGTFGDVTVQKVKKNGELTVGQAADNNRILWRIEEILSTQFKSQYNAGRAYRLAKGLKLDPIPSQSAAPKAGISVQETAKGPEATVLWQSQRSQGSLGELAIVNLATGAVSTTPLGNGPYSGIKGTIAKPALSLLRRVVPAAMKTEHGAGMLAKAVRNLMDLNEAKMTPAPK